MENTKTKNQIIHINFLTFRYILLIALGFSIFFIMSDYVFYQVWDTQNIYFYRILDAIYALIVVAGIFIFWIIKLKNLILKRNLVSNFSFLFLLWAAIITGIDFQAFGLSTFIIVLISFAFFLYFKPLESVVIFLSSSLALLITVFLNNYSDEKYLSLIFLFIPVIIVSILINARNYKNKLKDLDNQNKIIEVNKILTYTNENLEKEVEERTNVIQLALEKSEESERLKTAFIQNMSHEIRTPMNAIIGFSKLLDKKELNESKRKSYISIIISSANQLLSIVTDLLTISSIEANQEKLNINAVCINNIILEIITTYKNQAVNQNVSLQSKQELSDNLSRIYTDKTKLTQIFSILIGNALKFTNQGSIEFGYELKNKDDSNDSFLQFFVKDTGIGIDKSMQSRIFDHFRQADLSISKKYGGTGLGLSISRGLVELMGGNIWVDSEPGKGTVFYFTLPYNPVYEKSKENYETELPKESTKTILVVEDEEFNFLFIQELLHEMGFNLIHARNGQDAVEICESTSDILLVLMDIKLPGMDGHTASKLIKNFRPDLPIIAQSAFALKHEIEKYKDNTFDDYITKPINEMDFKNVVNKSIENSKTKPSLN